MNLYSEIYGAYYNIIAELLRRVSFTDEELREVVQRKGFGETMLYLIPKIESGSIALFEKDGELYTSVLSGEKPAVPFLFFRRDGSVLCSEIEG